MSRPRRAGPERLDRYGRPIFNDYREAIEWQDYAEMVAGPRAFAPAGTLPAKMLSPVLKVFFRSGEGESLA